jgi:hypothetical protein
MIDQGPGLPQELSRIRVEIEDRFALIIGWQTGGQQSPPGQAPATKPNGNGFNCEINTNLW